MSRLGMWHTPYPYSSCTVWSHNIQMRILGCICPVYPCRMCLAGTRNKFDRMFVYRVTTQMCHRRTLACTALSVSLPNNMSQLGRWSTLCSLRSCTGWSHRFQGRILECMDALIRHPHNTTLFHTVNMLCPPCLCSCSSHICRMRKVACTV